MPKSRDQKLKLLYLKQILEYHTDIDHGITRKDIEKYLGQKGIKVDRKTVYEDIHALEDFGMDIEHPENSNHYRLLSREFELAEIKLMIDSIQASKFLSEKTTRDLIGKLETLCSDHEAKQLQREVIVANRVKTTNKSIHYNVDTLHRAIASNLQVQFHYFDYDLHKNKKYFKKGEFYVVSPWRLIYTDDNYYLLAYDEKEQKFKHFRADKMDAVDTVEVERVGKEEFEKLDMANYTKYTFSMFGGEVENVELVFQNRMMGAVMDRFGRDIMPMKVDNNHFRVVVSVAVSQQFFGWIFSLGKAVRIAGPESVKEQMKKALADIAARYEDE